MDQRRDAYQKIYDQIGQALRQALGPEAGNHSSSYSKGKSGKGNGFSEPTYFYPIKQRMNLMAANSKREAYQRIYDQIGDGLKKALGPEAWEVLEEMEKSNNRLRRINENRRTAGKA